MRILCSGKLLDDSKLHFNNDNDIEVECACMSLNETDEMCMKKGNIYKVIYYDIKYITLNLQELYIHKYI